MAPHVLVADDDAWILRMVATVLDVGEQPIEEGHVGLSSTDSADRRNDDVLNLRAVDGERLHGELARRPRLAVVSSMLQPHVCKLLEGGRGSHACSGRIDALTEPSFELASSRSFGLVDHSDRPDPAITITDLSPSEPPPVLLLNDLDLAVRSNRDAVLRHGQEAIQAAASRSLCSSHASTADRR